MKPSAHVNRMSFNAKNSKILQKYANELKKNRNKIKQKSKHKTKSGWNSWKSLSHSQSSSLVATGSLRKTQLQRTHSSNNSTPTLMRSMTWSTNCTMPDKHNKVTAFTAFTARTNRSASMRSISSWGSKEQFYQSQMATIKHKQLQKTDANQASQQIPHLKRDESMLSKYTNWKKTLRKCQSSAGQPNPKRKRMKFGNVKKTITKSKSTPFLKFPVLSASETTLLECKSSKWSTTHGVVRKATNPVSAEEYYRYFDAFRAVAKKPKFARHYCISNKEIYQICRQLEIDTNQNEVNRMTDLMDQDGSGSLTFAELVHTLEELRANDTEPFLGGQVTIEMLLLAYSRRKTMKNILSKMDHNKGIDNILQSQHAELYLRHKNNFLSHTRKRNRCSHCFKKFEYSKELEDHLLSEHEYDSKFWTCYQCGEKWIPLKLKMDHIAQHRQIQGAKDGFKCQICKAVFGSRGCLAFHHSEHHKPLTLETFRCTKCDASFCTLDRLTQHQKELHTKETKKKQTLRKNNISEIGQITRDDNGFEIMTADEHRKMQFDFFSGQIHRGGLKNRVEHLRTIQKFRNKFEGDDRRVSILKTLFDKQDETAEDRAKRRRTPDFMRIYTHL